jgi:hypothetical protein
MPGIRAESVNAQSEGDHDFDLVDRDGDLLGIMEDTSATDSRVRRTDAAIEREQVIPLSRARHKCYVTPLVGCNLKNLRRRIDAFLSVLEGPEAHSFSGSGSNESAAAICRELRLEGAVRP